MSCKLLIVALAMSTAVMAQVPPRLQIPGAISIGAFPSGPEQQFRNERVLPAPGLNRIRRPQQLKSGPVAVANNFANPQPVADAKPVSEEREDEYQPAPYIPANFQPQQAAPQPPPQEQHLTESVRQLPIPQTQPQQYQRPEASGAQRFAFAAERQQPQPQVQKAARRPSYREASPAYDQEPIRRAQPIQSQHDSNRPRNSQEHHQNQEREQKPVAQILRKYREENEDGSITWGFENDDGSFKEEFIGVDCVTRGRYGYIDPDGMKREYNYETGIACDPNKRDSEEDDLPEEGERINIGNAINKARRPAAQNYRN